VSTPPEDIPPVDGLGEVVEDLVRRHLRRAGAMVSVCLGVPGRAPAYVRDERHRHYAASTMKLPLLVAAYRRHERGDLDLDDAVLVHNRFRSVLDGSAFSIDQDDDQDDETWALVGQRQTLRRLAWHATAKSGNLATNLLFEHVGPGEVAAVLDAADCSASTVLPRMIGDAAARSAGIDNLVTASDLALVMGATALGRLASPVTCAEVERVLAAQEHRDQVPAGLPPGTYVANKTGWVDGVAHDVALVRPADRPPYVLALCTTADEEEETLYALHAAVSAAIWERWSA
jgi:beta-lactamase class A